MQMIVIPSALAYYEANCTSSREVVPTIATIILLTPESKLLATILEIVEFNEAPKLLLAAHLHVLVVIALKMLT